MPSQSVEKRLSALRNITGQTLNHWVGVRIPHDPHRIFITPVNGNRQRNSTALATIFVALEHKPGGHLPKAYQVRPL